MSAPEHSAVVYRLNTATLRERLKACFDSYSKARYSRMRRVAARRAWLAARTPALAVPLPAPPVLLSAGKRHTLETIYRLALWQVGAYRHAYQAANPAQPPGPRRKPGAKPAGPPALAPLDFPARELHLRTVQSDLANECFCDVRTLCRHLRDFQTLGLVKSRRQLGLAAAGAPSYCVVLNADFLDWEEIHRPVASPGPAVPPPEPVGPAPVSAPAPGVGAARILQRTAQLQAARAPKPGT